MCFLLNFWGKIIEINEFYDKNERNNKNRQLTVWYLMMFENTVCL